MPSGRFAANGAWLAVQVMAHNLALDGAYWSGRADRDHQDPQAAGLRSGGTDHPLGAPPHFASPPALALGNPVQSRLGPAASHSIPGLTAPAATELPTAQPKVPANSRHPGPREFPAVYSLTIPRIAVPADGHRDPVRQLKTVRRPPIYPNGAQAISPAAPSPPSAVLTPSIGGFGLNRRWIGIDITHLAVTLIRHRLRDAFGDNLEPYDVMGEPRRRGKRCCPCA